MKRTCRGKQRHLYIAQSKDGELTKIGYSIDIEARRYMLSVKHTEMAVVYAGLNPKTNPVKLERMAKNYLSRRGFNGWTTDSDGNECFEWFHRVPNQIIAELICHCEEAVQNKLEYNEFARTAPKPKSVNALVGRIESLHEVFDILGRLYYDTVTFGQWYNHKPKDWSAMGREVCIESKRVHVSFRSKHSRVYKRKKAAARTALWDMTEA